jgi:hypothetical protein
MTEGCGDDRHCNTLGQFGTVPKWLRVLHLRPPCCPRIWKNPQQRGCAQEWIPAFAGMTELYGNDGSGLEMERDMTLAATYSSNVQQGTDVVAVTC